MSIFKKIFKRNKKTAENSGKAKSALPATWEDSDSDSDDAADMPAAVVPAAADPPREDRQDSVDLALEDEKGDEIITRLAPREQLIQSVDNIVNDSKLVLASPKVLTWRNKEAYVYRVESASKQGSMADLEFVIYIPIDTAVRWLDSDESNRKRSRVSNESDRKISETKNKSKQDDETEKPRRKKKSELKRKPTPILEDESSSDSSIGPTRIFLERRHSADNERKKMPPHMVDIHHRVGSKS